VFFAQGKYVKHNDNDGATLTDEQIPHAFSHFSYQVCQPVEESLDGATSL